MKKFFFYLIVLFAAVWLGLKIQQDPGYALFAYRHWTVEMPLWFAALLVLIVIVILHQLLRLFNGTLGLSKRFRVWTNRRKTQKFNYKTRHGLLELAEGRWSKAEKLLVSAAEYNTSPLINYLAAARAAQEQGSYEKRDDYLRMAHQSAPGAEVAIGLTQAELQLNHEQLEHGLATLRHLQSRVPQHTYVVKLLMQLYLKLADWESLLELIPQLSKKKIIDKNKVEELTAQAYSALLKKVEKDITQTEKQQLITLNKIWYEIPKSLHKEKSVVKAYCQQLIRMQKMAAVEDVLRDAIKHQWDDGLVELYGQVTLDEASKQLATAESWKKKHDQSAMLLLTLGRLSVRNQLWGKAKDYFIASLVISPDKDSYFELGKLQEYLNEDSQALESYRKGLQLAVD